MDAPTVLSLFAGVGMFDLGLDLAFPGSRTVCYVEREAPACETLAARFEDGTLPEAPIWSDVTTFDPKPWRGVDIVCGGFPCQPFSAAGQRKGLDDERWLWADIERVIRGVGPQLVILENVPGLALRGLDAVLGTLAEMGFDAEWGLFRASECGAPHRRERLFIVAERRNGLDDALRWRARQEYEISEGGITPLDAGQNMADAEGWRLPRANTEPGEQASDGGFGAEHIRGEVGDSNSKRLPIRRGRECEESELRHPFPPGPNDADAWIRIIEHRPDLAPAIPKLRGLDYGAASRVDRLRAGGNGLVPVVAALAIRTLGARLASRETVGGGE